MLSESAITFLQRYIVQLGKEIKSVSEVLQNADNKKGPEFKIASLNFEISWASRILAGDTSFLTQIQSLEAGKSNFINICSSREILEICSKYADYIDGEYKHNNKYIRVLRNRALYDHILYEKKERCRGLSSQQIIKENADFLKKFWAMPQELRETFYGLAK